MTSSCDKPLSYDHDKTKQNKACAPSVHILWNIYLLIDCSDALVQDCGNSSALAMKLLQSCPKLLA